jgi:hypothetical protein
VVVVVCADAASDELLGFLCGATTREVRRRAVDERQVDSSRNDLLPCLTIERTPAVTVR